LSYTIIGARIGDRGSHHDAKGDLAASCGSSARRGPAALLLLAVALSPPTAVAQRTPQPVLSLDRTCCRHPIRSHSRFAMMPTLASIVAAASRQTSSR